MFQGSAQNPPLAKGNGICEANDGGGGPIETQLFSLEENPTRLRREPPLRRGPPLRGMGSALTNSRPAR